VTPPYKDAQAIPAAQVMCFGCHRWVARAACSEVGGLLYGPECVKRARASCVFWCALCGCMFPEEAMFSMDTCKLCEAGL
jgi:hypothetical protein